MIEAYLYGYLIYFVVLTAIVYKQYTKLSEIDSLKEQCRLKHNELVAEFAELKGATNQFMKTPVLRQYIKENIPVQLTEDQKGQLKGHMNDFQRQWEEAHGLMDLEQVKEAQEKVKRKYPDRNELNPGDLV